MTVGARSRISFPAFAASSGFIASLVLPSFPLSPVPLVLSPLSLGGVSVPVAFSGPIAGAAGFPRYFFREARFSSPEKEEGEAKEKSTGGFPAAQEGRPARAIEDGPADKGMLAGEEGAKESLKGDEPEGEPEAEPEAEPKRPRPRGPKGICIALIRFYQKGISPLKKPCCKYIPTCSNYALEAVSRFGVLKGGFLALWRILRCNPFSRGGYDPVPEKKERPGSLSGYLAAPAGIKKKPGKK